MEKHISRIVLEASLQIMERFNTKTVSDINRGCCSDVSELVSNQVPGSINRCGPGHYWVEFEGLHYDAERPAGVSHPADLPCFQRQSIPPTHPDIQPSPVARKETA